ncbi:MAG: FkbM family methyltransferase [Opitutus sp.]|nr:FkbM family methyltransferase [Opitutus sp.]MCS6246104.1 FkbM family methyltransferase [Opitutus sp.]MCS6273644.1 FkbM family methyltransferase [Opitutus sp.]MCS6277813.1 FkbM family methyltransferase [Opitutus sp.]MCS6299081.1 FkbM family methyltransferase [Opitutus sp.]
MIFSRIRKTRPYALLREARYLWRHRARRAFYAAFVKPGSLVFDVGANVGNYTLIFRSLGARVVAIEPQSKLAADLARRFPPGRKGVHLERSAMGAAPGQAVLHKTADLSEVASLRSDIGQTSRFAAEHPYVATETVPVRTLAELIAVHGKPDFCKIDVEGFEHQVLAGLDTPIRWLSFEFNREYLDVAETCLARLQKLGPYEFNYTLGEDNHFTSCQWLDATALLRILQTSRDPLLWGDIHARLPASAR